MLFFKQCPVSYNTPYEKIGDEVRSLADEVPFDIPDSWEWVRLGTLLGIISDGTHKTPNYVENGVPFLSVQNISKGYFDFTKVKYITEDEHRKLCERVAPQAGDILFCRIGTLGKAIKCTLNIEFSIFVSLGLLRPIDPSVTDYLVFTINSPLGERWIQENKVGGGTHTYKINLSDIPNMLIPLPPYQEQDRIFTKLQELKPILHEYGKTEERLDSLSEGFPEALKKSILQEAVQGKLVPQDPTDEPAEALLERIRAKKQQLIKEGKIKKDKHESVIFRRDNSHYEKLDGVERCIDDELPFEIPTKWCWVRFESTITLLSGTDFAPDEYNSAGKGIAYITGASNIVDSQILVNRWTETPRQIAHAGDVLLVCKGSGYGKTVICNIAQAHIARQIMAVQKSDLLDMQYVKLFLDSSFDLLKAKGQGVIPGIDRTSVLHLLFPLPPLAEQHRIVQRIEELLPLVKGL